MTSLSTYVRSMTMHTCNNHANLACRAHEIALINMASEAYDRAIQWQTIARNHAAAAMRHRHFLQTGRAL